MSAMSIIHCAITIIALSLYSRRSSTIISHVHSPFSGSRGFDKFLFTCTTIKITLCLSSESVACYEKLGLASNKLSLPDKNKSLYVWLLIYWVSTIVNCGLWYKRPCKMCLLNDLGISRCPSFLFIHGFNLVPSLEMSSGNLLGLMYTMVIYW